MRNKLQNEILNKLIKVSKTNSFHFAEIQTGTGKTKILLDVAIENISRGKSVIITTSNNFLATNFLNEAKKFNIKEEQIEYIIGRDNYINQDIILSEEFLFTFSLDPFSVKEWLYKHKGKELITLFVSDFSLPDEAGTLLNLEKEDSDRNIKDISKRISDSPAIYVTNHYYFLTLLKHAESGLLDNIVILCDEVHLINNTARAMFSNTFSPFRLKYLLFEILKGDNLSKAGRKVISNVISKTDMFLSDILGERNALEDGDSSKAFMMLTQYKKEIHDPLSKYLATLQKKKSSPIVGAAYREMNELVSVLAGGNRTYSMADVSFSPVKGYPTFSVQMENPIAVLRKQISKHFFTFIGVSGTICVSPDTSVENNRWSFERIGFFKYKSPVTEEQKIFNKKVDSISLTVYPSIFSREQSRYYIAKEDRYKVPSSKKGENASERRYLKWIENLAGLCKETLWGNSVILMSSYENISIMKEKLEENGVSDEYSIFHHTPGISMKKLIEEYKDSVKSGKKSLLIGGLGFYTGIDLHGDFLNTLFFGKLPIEPSSYYSRMKIGSYSAQSDMRKNALLTFRQGIGRAIRTPDDRALIVVADPRIKTARYRVFEDFLQEYATEIKV